MTRVLFDARWIVPGMTGVGRVALEILRGIPLTERSSVGIILTESCPAESELRGFRIHRTAIALTSHPLSDLYEQTVIPLLCYRFRYTAFVSFEGRLPLWHVGFRTYGYIHDTTFISHWRYNGLKYSVLLWLHLAAMHAAATGIITVSNASKARLIRLARFRPRDVSVVYNADSGLDRFAASCPTNGFRVPYVLAVGMSNPRKNFPALARAFATFNSKGQFDLVVTGDRPALERMLRQIDGAPHIRLAGFVTDAELRHLYENASCLVYPSQEEGFGIPLLDAGLRNTSVACSDLDVFREVLGDDATYFDPDDTSSIAEALRIAVGPDAPRAKTEMLRKKFSWTRSALQLLRIAQGVQEIDLHGRISDTNKDVS